MGIELRDLGTLSGDVLVYGGPYSNLQATQALFQRADALAIPPARRICTGDVVAYCGDPVATTDLVRAEGGAVVAGNCEKQLAVGAEDCGCGFDEGSACDLLSKGWYPQALRALAPRDDLRRFFARCPDLLTFRHGAVRVAVIHGGLSDIARFLWSVSPEAAFVEEIALIEAAVGPVDIVLAGHCGVPFQRQIGQVRWLNAGVIGNPPNDGDPRTRFMILGEDGPRYEQLSYDHNAAKAAMQAAGLTQGYDAALTSGFWPSEDVLPQTLRRGSQGDGAVPQVL